jgi:hypothetical protein
MTKLTGDQVLTRETAAQERARPLVVELHARYLTVRVTKRNYFRAIFRNLGVSFTG